MKPFREPMYTQSYIDTGKGTPVILLHGMFGNVAMWRNTVNALKNRYRVIVPRLPLYDVPIHRANVKYLTEVLNDYLDWYQLTDVVLVGTDIGGQVALEYANAFPQNVKKVVISGSSGLFENLPSLDQDFNKDYDSVREHVQEAFFRKELVSKPVIDQVYYTINTFSKGLQISAFAKASKNNDVSHFLARLTTPVLMIWGLQDRITPPEVALRFHDLLKNGTMKFLDECGHLPMIEQADLYNAALTRFLESTNHE